MSLPIQVLYGAPNPLDHEGLRSGGRQPADDLQLDIRRKGGVRQDRRRLDPHLCGYAVARCQPQPVTNSIAERDDGCRAPRVNLSSAMPERAEEPVDDRLEFRRLFHQLNNQLGIILAHAELLESKASEESTRVRAAQVVASVLEAMTTAREIR